MWSFSRRVLGYDVQEVDDYLVRFVQYAEALEHRAVAAEQSLDERTHELAEARRRLGEETGEEVAGRMAQIFALAEDEARDILERAHAEERMSAERAATNADRALAETAEERRSLERQVAEISATRDNLLKDLRSLSVQMLHAAQQYDTPIAHDQPPASTDAGASPVEPSFESRTADSAHR
jgi:hypothetical protein